MRRINLAVIFSAVLLFSATAVTKAQTIGYGEAIRVLTAACGADIEKFCQGIKPGGGRIQACLAKQSGSVSPNCIQTYDVTLKELAKRAKAQEEAPKLCAAEAKRLCSNFRQGNARILRCLIRVDNVKKVSNKCNKAITNAGWR